MRRTRERERATTNILGTKSFHVDIHCQSPVGKFIRILEIQLFNIEDNLDENKAVSLRFFRLELLHHPMI